MNINQANYAPTIEVHGDTTIAIADQGDMTFRSVDWPGYPAIHTDGSGDDYIPDGDHVLPKDAALPMLRATDRWACPSPEKFAEVRAIVESTSNCGMIAKPGYDRLRHIVGLHLGGPQPQHTPEGQTRIEWYRDFHHLGIGGQRRRGWYHGTIYPDANGECGSNQHYNRLWTMGLALIYETDHARRVAAWPMFVQQAISYTCFGRFWSGKHKGMSRYEKGHKFVGRDSNGVDIIGHEKDWVTDLVMPWLLTGQAIFKAALDNAQAYYLTLNPAPIWGGGEWGARIPARMLENMLMLWHMYQIYRVQIEAQMKRVIDLVDQHLDRVSWLWPNKGNGNTGPTSPWMQSELCAVLLRVNEQVPGLKDYGVTRGEIVDVMKGVMLSHADIVGGSEEVGEFAMLRYRYHRQAKGEPMNAAYADLTAFAYPALRMLSFELNDQFWDLDQLMREYAGSSVEDVRNGTPRPLSEIGFRDSKVSGPAAPKVWAIWADAIR